MARSTLLMSACLTAALLAAGCTKSGEPTRKNTVESPAPNERTDGNDTNMPQATGDPWKDAEAIAAAKTKAGSLQRRTEELPYMFMARGHRGILVHQGRVVTETGPAVAAGYLRDIGIVKGPGPSIGSVLYALFVLHALPKVEDKAEEGYINSPSERMKDLTARVERDGGQARVVLHYFVDEGMDRGATAGPETRYLVRMTLTIGDGVKAAWKSEDVEWTAPE